MCEGEPRKVPQPLSLFSVSPFAAYLVTGATNAHNVLTVHYSLHAGILSEGKGGGHSLPF